MFLELHSLMLVTDNAVTELETEKARYAEQRNNFISTSAVGQMMQQQQGQQSTQQSSTSQATSSAAASRKDASSSAKAPNDTDAMS